MVAPVVLMTLATIFANGLRTVGASIAENMIALKRERLGLLRGPHGEMLDGESVPPMGRERLTQIGNEVPLMIGRFRRVRSAVMILWIAVALLVLSVALLVLSVVAIAVAVTVPSEGFAFTALALVMAGVAALFGGIVFMIGSSARLGDIVTEVTRRMGMPG
jgi:hypothetical protein